MRGGHSSPEAPESKDYWEASIGGLYEKERADSERWDEKHGLCGLPEACEV